MRKLIPSFFLAMLISLLPSCERESRDAIDLTYEALIEKEGMTKAFLYVNQPYQGKLTLNLDSRNKSRIETAFFTEATGYALVGAEKKKLQPGEKLVHDYRESPLPIEVYLSTIGTNTIRFDLISDRFTASVTDTLVVKDLHYTITADSLPAKMLVGKKFSFRLNIAEKEETSTTETTASGTIMKGAGVMYLAGDKVFINKSIVPELNDVLPGEGVTKAGESTHTLSIGKNILTYLPQLDETNEINLKVNNPYKSSQEFSMSFNVEKPVFATEAIVDKKSPPFVGKDYSFLLKVSQVDVYEGNEYSLTYRFLKSSADLAVNAKKLSQGETTRIKEGENIVVINSKIKENCDIELTVSDKYGSQYKDTAVIGFKSLPMYSVTVPVLEGGSVTGAGSYEESSKATLTATATTGYSFLGFYTPENTLISSNPEYSFTVLDDVTINTVFKKNMYRIDAIAGEGGTVTGGGSYEFSSNVSLRAKAHNGYSFAGWYEAERSVSTSDTYSFQASSARSLIGRFRKNEISASVNKPSQDVKVGQAASVSLSISEDNYTGTFNVGYELISGDGTFSGGSDQTVATGTHTMSFTPSKAGTHTYRLTVKDASNTSKEVNVTVMATLSPIVLQPNQTSFSLPLNGEATVSLAISEVAYSDKFTLRYDLSGASGAFKVNSLVLASGLTTSVSSGTATLKFQTGQVGDANLKITVSDTRGQSEVVNIKVTATSTISVSSGTGGTAAGGGTYNTLGATATPHTVVR